MPAFFRQASLSLLAVTAVCVQAAHADWLMPPQQPQRPRVSGTPFYAPQTPAGARVSASTGPHWAPGGDAYSGMRVGSPYYWSAPGSGPVGAGYGPAAAPYAVPYAPPGVGFVGGEYYGGGHYGSEFYGGYAGGGDPYTYHFGPGFHRHSDEAHYRFPFYSYRRPWYFPGHTSYNRDTNYPW